MSVSLIRHEAFDFYSTDASVGFIEGLSKFAPSKIAAFAIDTCLGLVEKSAISEPHFLWEDLHSVVISPSDYQFASLEDDEYELVTIDEEDIPFREFCTAALDSLSAYSSLVDGWDGEDAPAPATSYLDDAYTFLRLLSSNLSDCRTALPMLDHEGIPSFAFDNGTCYASIAFYGDDQVVSYFIDRTTKKSRALSFSLSNTEELAGFIECIDSL